MLKNTKQQQKYTTQSFLLQLKKQNTRLVLCLLAEYGLPFNETTTDSIHTTAEQAWWKMIYIRFHWIDKIRSGKQSENKLKS